MSLIMDLIGPELSELFALEFAKFPESDFVYSLPSTNGDQLVRPPMSSIMELIGPELSNLSAFKSENLPYLTLFTL